MKKLIGNDWDQILAPVQAQENGIEFLVATGRAPKESQLLLKDADIHTGFINLNKLIGNDWDQILAPVFESEDYRNLHNFLKEEYSTKQIYPDMSYFEQICPIK